MKKYTIWRDTIFMTSEEMENYARDIREICAEMDEEEYNTEKLTRRKQWKF